MRKSGLLGEDVSLAELAANTSGYSGAEIAGCVRGASSYALERQPRQVGLRPYGCGQYVDLIMIIIACKDAAWQYNVCMTLH